MKLVTIHDEIGMPCAWGLHPEVNVARQEAERQWQIYVRDHAVHRGETKTHDVPDDPMEVEPSPVPKHEHRTVEIVEPHVLGTPGKLYLSATLVCACGDQVTVDVEADMLESISPWEFTE